MLSPSTVLGLGDVIDVALTPIAEALSANDVIAAPQEVTDFFREIGGRAYLHTLVLLDEDDQAQDVDIVFMNATGSVGSEGAAFAPSDTVARTILGTVPVLTTDYSDANTSQIATVRNVGLMMKGASTSVFVAAVCRSGTPTYSAAGLRLRLGVMWD